MQIIIKEENGFMPETTIKISEEKIIVEENNVLKTLKYDKTQVKKIMNSFHALIKDWKNKYEEKKIIDDEIYRITIVTTVNKEIYIRNKYPDNWSKFILLRNKLIREELDV